MKVVFYCGYYPDRAHNQIKRRTEDYWNAYFYVWAVKVGSHRKDFYILKPERLNITKKNFNTVRETFGEWAASKVPDFTDDQDVLIVPVPSKDALPKAETYRSLEMVSEAFEGTDHADNVSDCLRWKQQLSKAHEGGLRTRALLAKRLQITPDADVKGKKIILVDELLSTGGTMLACADCLEAAGAEILGAITCGKTIYDFKTPAFGDGDFELTTELSDWPHA